MTLQNRVTPHGEIIATPERGTLMGNRGGRIHENDAKRLSGRRWASRQWIACLLEFKGWHREVMSPHRYTELFFLDEATALAAGHRPCALCRRGDYLPFVAAWRAGNPGLATVEAPVRAAALDRMLHAERLGAGRQKVTFETNLEKLPGGTMVQLAGFADQAWLLWHGQLHAWTPGGYTATRPAGIGLRVTVLTPRSIVNALRAGYVPGVHASAR